MNRISSALVLISLLLRVTSCRPPEAAQSANAAPGAGAGSPNAATPDPEDAALGPKLPPLLKEDLTEGSGPAVKKGDRVRVNYTGTLMNGTKFDSSLDRGVPLEFTVGEGNVIQGWDLGILGMKKGGKRNLTIPPHLAYDLQGSPPKIGPNATLRFEIELLEIL